MIDNTIYLHIGIPKTGTTNIQWFLENNYEQLKSEGVFIPTTGGQKCHMLLACFVAPKATEELIKVSNWTHKEIEEKFLNNFHTDIFKNCKKEDVILISSEKLGSRLQPKNIKKIGEVLKTISPNIKVIMYLRRQDKFFTSFYSTRIKMGYDKKLDIKAKHHIMDYDRLTQNWENEFGKENIIVRRFEDAINHEKNLIKDFMSNIKEINFDTYKMPPLRNPSLDVRQLEFLRLFNLYCPRIRKNGKRNYTRSDIVPILETFSTGKNISLTEKDFTQIIQTYKDSNKKVAKKYFNEEQLFKTDNYVFASENDLLTLKDAILFFVKIWKVKYKQLKWHKRKNELLREEVKQLKQRLKEMKK